MPDAVANTECHAARGRLSILAAAVLWSSSGLFAKAPTFNTWPLAFRGPLLGFWRALFAGLVLLPAIRRPRLRMALAPMALSFAAMNVTYMSAMTLSTAANAIWLQSTAPFWVLLAGMITGTLPSGRDLTALAFAAVGIACILFFEVGGQGQLGTLCGLAAGIAYAGVVLSLRRLREEDSAWLVALNNVVTAVILLPFVLYTRLWPTPMQLLWLVLFGVLQMGLPYLLFARGLQRISAQEATLIGLLEPVLLPLWVYLAYREQPASWTLIGGALILAGLGVRYLTNPPQDPVP